MQSSRGAGEVFQMRGVLDFETRSTVDLKKTSATEYAKHDTTSIFCLGYKIDDGDTFIWIPERAPMPDDLWECFKSGILVAHSSSFERAVAKYTLPRYPLITPEQRDVLENLSPSRWRCSAAKAAASSLPRSLGEACRVLGLSAQKNKEGHRLMLKHSKPRKPSKNNPKLWWDDKSERRQIYIYCIEDVQAEYILDQELPDLSKEEQKVWELDQKINDRGVLLDIPTVKIILNMISEEIGNIKKKVVSLSNGTIQSATQRQLVLDWVNARGADMTNLQSQSIRDKLEEHDLSDSVRSMLSYRQWSSKTSTGKYISMLKAVGDDNRARETLLYCGASVTGRWSGKRLQLQNMPRSSVKNFNSDEAIKLIKSGGLTAIRKKYGENKVMDVLSSSIRGMIIASPDNELYCADFAAVEARLAFWMAEHEDGIQAYIEGKKLYEEMAANIFDMNIEDVGKDSLERFVGKSVILGAQYGIGPPKFLKTCHQLGMKRVTLEIAKKAVYTYRKVHAPIPAIWKALEIACVQAIREPGEHFQVTKVDIYVKGRFLNIKLPSGRRLRYFKPRLSQKQLAGGRMVPVIHHWAIDNHQWSEVATWSGVIFNNIIQGIARDLMAFAMTNIEKAGYKMLATIHDEALAERKIGEGSIKDFISLMSKLPSWAEGAPITSDGWTNLRYKK